MRTSWEEREIIAAGTPVRIRLQVLDELLWVIEGRYRLGTPIGAETIAKKDEIHQDIQQRSLL